MSDININFEKRDIRVLIAFFFKKGYSAEKCAEEINSTLGAKTTSLATVFNWYKEFRFGRTSLEDAPRAGRPQEVNTEENVSAIRDLVKSDPHITIRQASEELKITAYAAHHIIRNLLNLRKLSVQWVPHLLTAQQMETRVKLCQNNLKRMRDGGQQIISKILTGDETWVYYYDVPSNREAKVWVFEDEERPKLAKKELHVKKIMYAVFFRSTGIVSVVKLGPKQTITAKWYIDNCLKQLFDSVKIRGLILHHDNARPHKAIITREFLEEKGVELMEHPPYSPDLAPCDFWLFRKLKKNLRGKRFELESEIDLAVQEFFNSIPKEDWRGVFTKWQERMERCIQAGGDYF